MTGIPLVARQEFRQRLRAGRWRLLLLAWAGVLVLFTGLLARATRGLAVPGRGGVVYGGLTLLVLSLALLVVPSLAAQSVNGDRERGTLAVLQVTRLSPTEIVLGKFLASWGTALVFLALSLPLAAYAVSLGGVGVWRVVVVTVVVALLLGTVCALSLWLSAALARTTTSAVLSYLTVFGLTVGTVVVFGLVTALTSGASEASTDVTWPLLAPNPFVVVADAAPEPSGDGRALDPLGALGRSVRTLRSGPGGDAPVWPVGLAVDVLLAAGALALAVRAVRTPTRDLPPGQRVA